MAKKISAAVLIFFLVFIPGTSYTQSVEKEFAALNNCVDIEVVAMQMVPGFYYKKQFDSIELILDFVSIKCIESESLRMTRFLVAIQNRAFHDSMLSASDIYLIKKESKHIRQGHLYDFNHFRNSAGYSESEFARNSSRFMSRSSLEFRMIDMLTRWANELISKGNLSTLELSVLDHIRGRPRRQRAGLNLFREVNKRRYAGTAVRKAYDEYHDNFVMNRAYNVGLGYMQWLPFGEAGTVYGTHPGVYFKFGYSVSKRDRFDFIFGTRIGKTNQPFNIVRPDTSFTSSRALTSIWGMDYFRTLWRPGRRFELNVNAGAGLERRMFYKHADEDPEVDNEPGDFINAKMGKRSFDKFYYNAGIELNYFIFSGVCISVHPRYLFSADFSREVTTPIKGNQIIINAGVSFFINGHPARDRGFWNLFRM